MQVQHEKRWIVADLIPDKENLNIGELGSDLSPYLMAAFKQLLFNRNVKSSDDVHGFLFHEGSIYDPYLLSGMRDAVQRIFQAVDSNEKIAVYGDYDVDGVTSTALLVQAIRRFGGNVIGFIPNRFEEGYGLGNDTLKSLYDQGISLVVTVDCGIRSPQEVEYARQIGQDIIITDHHEPKGDIPCAYAVINPKLKDEIYPERNLAGVGIAYKIVEAMHMNRQDLEITVEDWLDLVAVGTVADIVPLTGENRTIVKAGIKKIRQGQRQGIFSLAKAAGLDVSMINARDIAFMLGPRLNAAGRLDSAMTAYELLMTDDVNVAGLLAQKLDDQNRQRQEETRHLQIKSEEILQQHKKDHLLFAVDSGFNMGLVGLAASKLVDTYYLPAIVGNKGDEFTRASCRSIEEFHITKALDECSDLLERHGGHAMAAGFTVRNENLSLLEERLREIAARELQWKNLCSVLRADIEIPLSKLHPNILKYIDMIEPIGTDNPEVLFLSRNVSVHSCRAVGTDHSHLRLNVSDGNISYNAIAFRQAYWMEKMPDNVDIIYSYEVNNYQGRTSLQLNIRGINGA